MASLTSGLFTAGELAHGPTKVACVADGRGVGTSHSRSTSPGSSSHLTDASTPPTQHLNPVRIRNTFIEEMVGRPISLEGFLHERVVQSCPASRGVSFDEIGAPPGLESFVESLSDEADVAPESSRFEDVSMPLPVRNTFIDLKVGRPVSLEGFFQERATVSCPVSREASLEDFGTFAGLEGMLASMKENPAVGMPESPPIWPAIAGPSSLCMPPGLESLLAGRNVAECAESLAQPAARTFERAPLIPPPMQCAPVFSHTELPPPPASVALAMPALHLAEVLDEPDLGSAALPTVGSADHRYGTCRPCAFMHTKGCNNGVQCSFCHLCPAGERKLRKREKKIQRYETKRVAAAASQGVLLPR